MTMTRMFMMMTNVIMMLTNAIMMLTNVIMKLTNVIMMLIIIWMMTMKKMMIITMILFRLKEVEMVAECKELRLKVMDLETQRQVWNNQVRIYSYVHYLQRK